jgi:hypothetical protein
MSGIFKQYDPGLVTFSFAGILVVGYAEGTFLRAERMEDAVSLNVGSGGDVVRVINRNRSGFFTITLQNASPSNDLLSAVARQDELFGTGIGPAMLKNINSTLIISSPVAWIRKVPAIEFSKEATNNEWIIDCAEMIPNIGGALI